MIFGLTTFATYPFAWGAEFATSSSSISTLYDLSLNGTSLLQTTKYFVSAIDDRGEIELIVTRRPKNDGNIYLDHTFPKRTIALSGVVLGATNQEYLDNLDDFKKTVLQNRKYFVRKIGADYRYCIVSPTSLSLPENNYNVTFNRFQLELESTDAYWTSTNVITRSFLGQTVNFTDAFVYAGTARCRPKITIAFTSATSVTSVALTNDTIGLTVTSTFIAGDFLEIDTLNYTVKKNNAIIDYSGTFPIIDPNLSNSFVYAITGTWTADINFIYSPTFH